MKYTVDLATRTWNLLGPIDKPGIHEYIRLNRISSKIVPSSISDCFYFI